MKKFYLLLIIAALLMCKHGNAQYYYIPFINAGANPGGINNDGEYPVGGGIPPGWTNILAGGTAQGTYSPTQTIPFTFIFNFSLFQLPSLHILINYCQL